MKTTKELMVGDWVSVNGGMPMFVQDIYDNNTVYLDFEAWEEDIKNIEPIEITRKILKDNGFKIGVAYSTLDIDSNKHFEYYHHEHRLRLWWEGIDEWENHSLVKSIIFQCHPFYVHELQHAFRLCKIDKEIVL